MVPRGGKSWACSRFLELSQYISQDGCGDSPEALVSAVLGKYSPMVDACGDYGILHTGYFLLTANNKVWHPLWSNTVLKKIWYAFNIPPRPLSHH